LTQKQTGNRDLESVLEQVEVLSSDDEKGSLQSSDGETGSRAVNIPFWQRKRNHERALSLDEKRNCFPFIPKEKKQEEEKEALESPFPRRETELLSLYSKGKENRKRKIPSILRIRITENFHAQHNPDCSPQAGNNRGCYG
jgi:hypothetical protein